MKLRLDQFELDIGRQVISIHLIHGGVDRGLRDALTATIGAHDVNDDPDGLDLALIGRVANHRIVALSLHRAGGHCLGQSELCPPGLPQYFGGTPIGFLGLKILGVIQRFLRGILRFCGLRLLARKQRSAHKEKG